MAKLLKAGRNTLSRALSSRPDYLRLTKAQIAETEKLAFHPLIQASESVATTPWHFWHTTCGCLQPRTVLD